MKLRTILGILGLLALTACSKDEDYHYPNAITDFVELDTDRIGKIMFIRTDDGQLLRPAQSIKLQDATTDSTYRVRCTYYPEKEGDNHVQLYNVNGVVSPHPVTADQFEEGLITDPLKVVSIWKSGEYINCHLGVLTKGAKHTFHFIKEPMKETASGNQILKVTLYHAQGNDPEAFTRDAYLSCPLSKTGLQPGDSILFSVQTYDKMETFRFIK